MKNAAKIIATFIFIFISPVLKAQENPSNEREHLLMDFDWRFALGHAYDTKRDFDFGTQYFSYLAKTGYGDGVFTSSLDDRAWRKLNLPHDWAVEQPFSPQGSLSHGFKAIGRNFPGASVGWYRKTFTIPANDLGKHISLQFDGVFRNSIVWVNGHYLGTEPSGYTGFEYNVSEFLNYGDENTVVVRVDATMEEGWFYEGAGIYRHVWLNKTSPVHVGVNGTFVTSTLQDGTANVTVQTTVVNETTSPKLVEVSQVIIDAQGKQTDAYKTLPVTIAGFKQEEISASMPVLHPVLWSLDSPNLYKMLTTVFVDGKAVDTYTTTFGIRIIRFDATKVSS